MLACDFAHFLLTYRTRRSTHVEVVVTVDLTFCHSLRRFRSDNIDTGNGASLIDVFMIRLAAACLILIYVFLKAATGLTDVSSLTLVTKYSHLQYVAISGNDKVPGSVKGTALEEIGRRRQSEDEVVEVSTHGSVLVR